MVLEIRINMSIDRKTNMDEKSYKKFVSDRESKRPVLINCIRAFFVGGFICLLGQIIQWIFIKYFGFTINTAGNPTGAILIIISVILTGLGIYDKLGQWAGAGTAIPITGFANTIASAAIEHRSEGYVLGVGGNMFKLAGSVIAFGVFSAFIVAIIKILFMWIGGM
jgi:stage V sporulation protein AC